MKIPSELQPFSIKQTADRGHCLKSAHIAGICSQSFQILSKQTEISKTIQTFEMINIYDVFEISEIHEISEIVGKFLLELLQTLGRKL